jgi:hypothetical protein
MVTGEVPGPTPSVVVEAVELPADELARARALGNSIVILPRRRADDGRGVYGEATVFLAKDLRAQRVDVAYLDPSEARLFEVKKSAILAVFVTIVLGISSAAGWDGIKALLKRERADDTPMEVTYADLAADGSGKSWRVRGSGKDVIEAIDRLRSAPPNEEL